MKSLILITLWIIAGVFSACKKANEPVAKIELNHEFKSSTEDWIGDFADYPNESNVEKFYEFEFSHAALPKPLNTSKKALMQSGKNHSDDLFMFIKKKITGLTPNKMYEVDVALEIASNVPKNMIGVGGSPGENVYIKAGASTIEPKKVLDKTDNHYRMNIDKGNQAQDGADMKLVGNFANGIEREEYVLKTLKTPPSILVKANANGELWVVVGTDSGFEAKTTIYYNSIKVLLR